MMKRKHEKKLAVLLVCLFFLVAAIFPATTYADEVTPPDGCIAVDNGVVWDAVGYGPGGTCIYANRLQGFTGNKITKIWFYFGGDTYVPVGITGVTLKVFEVDGETLFPGAELYSQPLDMATFTHIGWYGFELTTSVTAPADQLFVGIQAQGSPGYIIGSDNDTDGGTNSVGYSEATGWVNMETVLPTNFMIRAEVQPNTHDITVISSKHGLVETDLESAVVGDTVNLTVTPEDGYQLVDGSLKVNGAAIEGTSFIMPSENVTITAEFALVESPVIDDGNNTTTDEDTNPATDEDTNPDTGDSTNTNLLLILCLASMLSAMSYGGAAWLTRRSR